MGIIPPELEALLAVRAAAAGETPAAFLQRVLDAQPKRPMDMAAIRSLQERHRSRPLLDDRPLKEIRDELWGL